MDNIIIGIIKKLYIAILFLLMSCGNPDKGYNLNWLESEVYQLQYDGHTVIPPGLITPQNLSKRYLTALRIPAQEAVCEKIIDGDGKVKNLQITKLTVRGRREYVLFDYKGSHWMRFFDKQKFESQLELLGLPEHMKRDDTYFDKYEEIYKRRNAYVTEEYCKITEILPELDKIGFIKITIIK